MFLTVIWSVFWLGTVAGYRNGPPYTVCDSMIPGHGGSQMTTEAPYSVTFSKPTYSPNDQITVTLSGKTANDTFRGFFIQPRTDVNTYATVGTFPDTTPKTRNPCSASGNAALAHTEPPPDPIVDKTSISFTWNAPDSDVGPVIFVYTIVRVQAEYWVKLQSDPITFQSSSVTPVDTGSPSQSPSNTSSQSPLSTQSTQSSTENQTSLPNIVINWDPECGSKKGCYPGPAQCLVNCEYLVTWKPMGDSDVQFTLKRRASGDKWIAIGFSDDKLMGNDSVVGCDSLNGTVVVQSSYNQQGTKQNSMLDTSSYGISAAQTSHTDGIISCTFNRKVSADMVTGRKKRAVSDETTFFDLNTPWYLFVAMGDMNAATSAKKKHSQAPKVSANKIDFLTVGDQTGTTQSPPTPGEISKGSDCGSSVGCMHDCDSSGKCSYYISWKDAGENVDMTITCKQTNNRYCAVGFSRDTKMGGDGVIECSVLGGNVVVTVSYNDGRSNSRLDNPAFGLLLKSGTFQNGILSCSFLRKKTAALATGRKKRAAANQNTFVDLNADWYILFAKGPAGTDSIGRHDVPPLISTQKADFQATQDLGTQQSKKILVTIHGILMVVAWLMLVNIGIVLPRHYKQAWQETRKMCGQAVWFQLHRFCMVFAFLCTAAAFIVIFVHVGGYAEISGSNFEKAHPIMGIAVMALALINPIMALFRCHPGTPKRPIFNAFHFLVGIAAQTVGIVNMYAGVLLASSGLPDYILYILYAFCGWIVFFELVMFVHTRIYKQGTRSESYELKGSADSTSELTPRKGSSSFKIAAFYLHVLVLLGLCAAVCVIIGRERHGDDHDHDD